MAGSTDPLGLQQLLDKGKEEAANPSKETSSKKRKSRRRRGSKKANTESSGVTSTESSGTKPKKQKRKNRRLESSSNSEGHDIVAPLKPMGVIPKLKPVSQEPVVPVRRSDAELTQMAKSLHKIPSKKTQKANWERLGRQVVSRPLVSDYNDVWDVKRVRGMRRPKYLAQVDVWNEETSLLFNQRSALEKVVQARVVDLRFDTMYELRDELPELFNFFKMVYEPENW